jgi:hypothetical protein
VIGFIGTHLARGRTVIAGYTVWGLCIALLAVTGNLPIALGLMFGSGVANMVFIIPSQTMFQERTPPRCWAGSSASGSRSSSVDDVRDGDQRAARPGRRRRAGAGGLRLMTMFAGLAGLLVPAVRDA